MRKANCTSCHSRISASAITAMTRKTDQDVLNHFIEACTDGIGALPGCSHDTGRNAEVGEEVASWRGTSTRMGGFAETSGTAYLSAERLSDQHTKRGSCE